MNTSQSRLQLLIPTGSKSNLHYSIMHSTSVPSRSPTIILSSNTTIFSITLKYKPLSNSSMLPPSIISINSLVLCFLNSSPSPSFHISIKWSLFSTKALKLLTKALYKTSSSICLFLHLNSPFFSYFLLHCHTLLFKFSLVEFQVFLPKTLPQFPHLSFFDFFTKM